MSENIFEFPYKVLTSLGLWGIESKNRLYQFTYGIYQLLAITYLGVFTSFLLWDLHDVRKDVHRASTNLSATMTTLMLFWKNMQGLQKLPKVRQLQRSLKERLHTLQDDDDREILKNAAAEMKKTVIAVYSLGMATMTGWLSSGFVLKSREQEDNLPLPLSIPWDHQESPYYELAWLFQSYGGYSVTFDVLSINLFIFGTIVQICAEYDILLKNTEKINEWHKKHVGSKEEHFRTLTKEENSKIEEMIVRNIQHHQKIIDCTKEAENCYVHMMVIQFGGSALLITVVSLDFIMVSKEMSFRLYPLMVFLMLLVCDIYLFCHYGSRLIDKSGSVSSETIFQSHQLLECIYRIPWEVMSEKNKKMIFLIILKAQRPPKLTVEKFADIDFYSLLKLTKIVYNVLYLLLHLAKNGT